ncbi:uncharacterized protein G2W53_028959 [Senna tora]|uniref:Uncharacterized protein n=1 Tax=Senna tora TaxID=362788 RepID=A0A834T3N4_9FABA|nr:uncharacterized protein G2W53_028959 [Senna tora]
MALPVCGSKGLGNTCDSNRMNRREPKQAKNIEDWI